VEASERAPADDEERFRLLVDGVKDYAILMLAPDGTIVSWNSGGERIKGYRADEVIGRHFSIFYTPEAAARGHPEHELTVARREGRFEEEGWRVRKDGTQFWASVVITALFDNAGELRGFGKVTRDMSERRLAREAERAARDAAERASRAKTEFLSGMSHELRTPLNAVLGFAQVLALDTLTPHQREAVDQIAKAGELLLGLVDELLDISLIEAERMTVSLEPVHVGGLILECVELIEPIAAQHHVQVIAPPRRDMAEYVVADQQRLKQVLMNLLSNAVKYNRSGGTVRVAAAVAEQRVRISVADTGPGLDAEDLDRLFVPFERLGASESGIAGTGLGLALSKRLIELMDGTIAVESTPGAGSVFSVDLGRTDGPDLDAAAGLDAAAPAVATVLYIEDNLANLHLVEMLLSRMGSIEVLTAMQGQLGLELARSHLPDLILLDLHLPDMDGEDVARVLRTDDAGDPDRDPQRRRVLLRASPAAGHGRRRVHDQAVQRRRDDRAGRAADRGSGLAGRGDQPRLVGVDHRLHAVAQPELAQQVGDVALDRGLRHHERAGDLGVREARGKHPQHLALALGQPRELLRLARDGRGEAAADLVEQPARDGGREHGVAGGDGADRLDDPRRRRVLEQEAAGAGPQRGDDVVVEAEGREDQDPLARQPAGRLDPVHPRHPDVHQHDVGHVQRRGLDRLRPVSGLGHDLDVAGRLQHRLEAGAHHRLVVGDHDPQRRHATPSS
jgi:PAS domain S-box-containing protein